MLSRIERCNAGREPELLAVKYEKMRKSPFSLFRGTAHLFWEDLGAQTGERSRTCSAESSKRWGSSPRGRSCGAVDAMDPRPWMISLRSPGLLPGGGRS
jgi:hypothetical protein